MSGIFRIIVKNVQRLSRKSKQNLFVASGISLLPPRLTIISPHATNHALFVIRAQIIVRVSGIITRVHFDAVLNLSENKISHLALLHVKKIMNVGPTRSSWVFISVDVFPGTVGSFINQRIKKSDQSA